MALQALKRKKNHEKKLQQIDGTLTTLEYQRDALDAASTNTAVFQTMGEAAKALKKAHLDMDVDEVHDVMDDIAEQQEVANEISNAISNPVGFGNDIDEDELVESSWREMDSDRDNCITMDEFITSVLRHDKFSKLLAIRVLDFFT